MESDSSKIKYGGVAMILQLSKVNGGLYQGELLPRWPIRWPTDTWLQRKLRERTVKDDAQD